MKYNNKIIKNQVSIHAPTLKSFKSPLLEKDIRLSNFNINTQHNKILRLFLNKLSADSFSLGLQGATGSTKLISSPAIRSINAFQEQNLFKNRDKVLNQRNKYLPSLFIVSSHQSNHSLALNATTVANLKNNKEAIPSSKKGKKKKVNDLTQLIPLLLNKVKYNVSKQNAPRYYSDLPHQQHQALAVAGRDREQARVSSNTTVKDPLLNFNIDKRILPFFSSPLVLKKISDQKKNKNFNLLNPQKKLIYKIIKLNEKLIKLTTSIKKYNLNLNSFKGNKSDFILFIRNNLYYNLKFRLSNILYKIEKFIPVLKFHSLLNNINLFVPKRLLKPQPYIRFTYRMIQINKIFNFNKLFSIKTNSLANATRLFGQGKLSLAQSPTSAYAACLSKEVPFALAAALARAAIAEEENARAIKYILLKLNNLLKDIDYIINIKNKLIKIFKVTNIKNLGALNSNVANLNNLENNNNSLDLLVSRPATEGAIMKYDKTLLLNYSYNLSNVSENTSPTVLSLTCRGSLPPLFPFPSLREQSEGENLTLLPGVLTENKIKIKETIKSITNNVSTSIEKSNLSNLSSNSQPIIGLRSFPTIRLCNTCSPIAKRGALALKKNELDCGSIALDVKKDNINNNNKKFISLLNSNSQLSLVTDKNIGKDIKFTSSATESKGLLTYARQAWVASPSLQLKQEGAISRAAAEGERVKESLALASGGNTSIFKNFDWKVDPISINSNPVDLLYFNNNSSKPIINQYLKSMSIYNMISNGTILYYSNIIGFNFKKRVRAYLPFYKSSLIKYKSSVSTFFNLNKNRVPFGIFGRGIENNKLIKNIYKFLYLSFKSMYCLISKPVFIIKSNKIIIQLFYFLLIPKILKNKKKKTFYYFKKYKGYKIVKSLKKKNIGSAAKAGARKTNFNYYNKFNRFLLAKFYNSKRLSKIILPNAKILQKLGIPQWKWPYSGVKKKGILAWIISGGGMDKLNKTKNIPFYFNESLASATVDLKQTTAINNYNEKGIYHWGGVSTPCSANESCFSLSGGLLKQGSEPKQKNWKDKTWPFSFLLSSINSFVGEAKTRDFNLSTVKNNMSFYKSKNKSILPSLDTQHLPLKGLSLLKTKLKMEQEIQLRSDLLKNQYTKRSQLIKLANINLIKLYPLKFEKLCEVLNSIFNKPVELDLIRLHYPYNDSNILVRLLAFMINKIKLRRITRKLFKNAVIKSIKKINNKDQVNIIPAFLSGMTIKVAGRLMKYKVIPRKTVKIVRRGSSSIGKINYSDFSRYTNKNKRGAFTITIKSGQNFFL